MFIPIKVVSEEEKVLVSKYSKVLVGTVDF